MLYSWKYLLFSTFAKAGPWALLCAIILGLVWYETDKWVTISMASRDRYIYSQEQYIQQSQLNVITLQKAVQTLTETVTHNTERFGLVADDVRRNQQMLDTQNKLMSQASDLMREVPSRNARILVVLERLDSFLRLQDSHNRQDGTSP